MRAKKLFTTRSWNTDLSLLFIRFIAGFAMLLGHGLPKFNKATAGGEIKFMDFMGLGPEISLWLAVFAELVCAGLLALGLFTRLSLVPLIITMSVAVFSVHLNDPFKKMESALIFLVIYLALFISGPGKYSLDRAFFGKK